MQPCAITERTDHVCANLIGESPAADVPEEPPGMELSLSPRLGPVRVVPLPVVATAVRRAQLSPRSRAFLNRFYPHITSHQWNDWQWQVANRISSLPQLMRLLHLSRDELVALSQPAGRLPLGITPYYAALLSADDADQALRRCMVPTTDEFLHLPGEAHDPLHEEDQSPVPGLVHRYPDRALLLATDFCAAYCRYCTRSRVVGGRTIFPSRKRLEKAIAYIAATPAIHDVIVSGGDPLTIGDERLDWLLTQLRRIPHLDIIRIGTKVPAVLPQRITPKLTRMLKKHHPLWMSLHFTHPDECTPEAYRACALLADAGIPLGSQTVLLKGINDDTDVMRDLMYHLLRMRVRPYYLYQCDPISGSGHLRTAVARGLEIIAGLRGFVSGYAVPTFVVDAPGGGGKIPLMPDYNQGREGEDLLLRNYQGRTYRYPDRVTD